MVNWPLYDPCRSRIFSLIPSLDSPAREMPIESILNPSQVRIGSAEFLRKPGGTWEMTSRSPSTGKSLPYWDQVVRRGPYVVRSRRRLTQRAETETLNIRKPIHMTVITSRAQGPAWTKNQWRPGEDSETTDSDIGREVPEDVVEDMVSSPGELWTTGFSSYSEGSNLNLNDGPAGSASDDEILFEGPAFSESDSATQPGCSPSPKQVDSDTDQDSIPNDAGLPDDADEYDDSAGSLETRSTMSDAYADDEKSDGPQDSDGSECPDVLGQPFISSAVRQHHRFCDVCEVFIIPRDDSSATTWYTCGICHFPTSSWDICVRCLSCGHWCNDKNHQLKKMRRHGGRLVALGVVSINTTKGGLNIAVYRESDLAGTEPVKIFQHVSRDSAMLYDSAPIIHPAAPLLVYALDGQRFLLANLGENTYLNHDIPVVPLGSNSTLGTSRAAISVQMRFSQCGRLLHVVRFLGQYRAPLSSHHRCAPSPQQQQQQPTRSCSTAVAVSAQLFTVQLSPRNLCSGRPRTLARHHAVALGDFPATATTRLPFTVTWTDAAAFVSVIGSGETLRVYRMPLAAVARHSQQHEHMGRLDGLTLDDGGVVETPSGEVVLPRSARSRAAYFVPAAGRNGNAVLVLGAGYREQMAAPVVVHLRPQSLGVWQPASEATIDVTAGGLETRADLEDFDVNSDCDLIMPLLDHQR